MRVLRDAPGRPGGALRRQRLVVAVAVVVAIGVLDLAGELADRAREWPLVVQALLDEPAHALTAYLLLLAIGRPVVPGRTEAWVLAGAVLIDVDHLPLFLGSPGWAVDGGRPPTHSLLVAVALLGAGLAARRAAPARYLAAGVLLHLVRDLSTGPGVPLLWPLGGSVLLPYAAYAVVMLLAAAACAVVPPRLGPARQSRVLRTGKAQVRNGRADARRPYTRRHVGPRN